MDSSPSVGQVVHPASIDRDRLSGDESGFVRSQETDHVGDFVSLARSQQHGPFRENADHLIDPLLSLSLKGHVGRNQSGTDGVDADAMSSQLEGAPLAECQHG